MSDDKINVKITGDSELMARLQAMPEKVHRELVKKITALDLKLEARVKEKLSNNVLKVQSGNLRASIHGTVEQTSTSVTGKVASSGDVKYAAIHEFGGTINVPEIIPTKAQALHFIGAGGDVFAKRVRAHTVTMPQRSYLRSSLADMKQEILDGLRAAGVEALKK